MIELIVAQTQNGGIGNKGRLPWKIPEEMELFKTITRGGVVIMGKNTWFSLKEKQLPDRINIVISKTLQTWPPNIFVFDSFLSCLRAVSQDKSMRSRKIFVIGGAAIYEDAMRYDIISKYHISTIHEDYECDTFISLPNFMLRKFEWKETLETNSFTYDQYIVKNLEEKNLIAIIENILHSGRAVTTRTGIDALSIFSEHIRFSLRSNKFPLRTYTRASFKVIFEELMANIKGITDTRYLEERGINIWKENSNREFLDANGLMHLPPCVIGESYGFQMRNFGGEYDVSRAYAGGHYSGFDQLQYVIDLLKKNPTSRRIIISLWNPNSLKNCALPACACFYEFYVAGGFLSCKLTQRSSDITVAGMHNVSYGALLTIMLAHVCDLMPAEFIWSPSNIHIYTNNIEKIKINEPRPFPLLFIKPGAPMDIEKFEYSDFELLCYNPWPAQKNRFIVNP